MSVNHRLQSLPYTVSQTIEFKQWIERLSDVNARARINLGDVRSLGKGVSEMRIHYGAGYRVYFTERKPALIILLCGGDKRTQARDIARAHRMVGDLG